MEKDFLEQLKDLNGYKGKEVIVHAYRSRLKNGVPEKQFFSYKGIIDDKVVNKISRAYKSFVLDYEGIRLVCNFDESSGLHSHECTIVSVDDAKTGNKILENVYVLVKPQNEVEGCGIISGTNGEGLLANHEGRPAVLLDRYTTKEGLKYMSLLLDDDSVCHTEIPKNFSLKAPSKKEEDMVM